MMADRDQPPEKYSSYKNRKFNKYYNYPDKIVNGIKALSLKRDDKKVLLTNIIAKLQDKLDIM